VNHYYSRIPAAAVFTDIDGNRYAHIPHRIDANGAVIESFDKPRMVRFGLGSFFENGEAFVFFARTGLAIPVPLNLPFGVTVRGVL